METMLEPGSWWSYVVVFLAAATPVIEVLVVIPTGVLAGMPPGPTAAVAVAGNLTTVVAVAFAGDRMAGWWRARRAKRTEAADLPEAVEPPDPSPRRDRSGRARELARRWGVPGLALLAPITTGTHVATVAAVAAGNDVRRVLRWMTGGLVAWAAAAAVATSAGLDLFA